MQALRNIYTVQNNQIIIDLPKSFKHKSVEVIILPIWEFNNKQDNQIDKNERLKKLLTISEWSDEDIDIISESQNYINQWKIEEF